MRGIEYGGFSVILWMIREQKSKDQQIERKNQMKSTILLINFKDQQKLRKLKMALLPFKIRLKTVEPQDYCQPVGYLAGVKEISKAEIPTALIPQEQMEKEMLVIAGITGNLFDQVLFTLRKAGTPVDYKAVLTEHNQNWSCIQLYKELEKEHKMYHPK